MITLKTLSDLADEVDMEMSLTHGMEDRMDAIVAKAGCVAKVQLLTRLIKLVDE